MGLRLAFFGSPEFAVPALDALHGAGHQIEVVYTQPPRPSGRGYPLTRCAVHARAEQLGLPVRTPRRLRHQPAEWDLCKALRLDAAIVAAYGLILPSPMLEAPSRGCLNIHASLLPRWRGAAPIQAALLAGDTQTGVTIMRMDEGLDTGPIVLQEAISIGPRETTRDLLTRLATLGAALALRALDQAPEPTPQPVEGATYAPKLERSHGVIDWTRDSAAIDAQVRALTPWPGTSTTLPRELGGQRIKILSAHPVELSGDPGVVLDDRLTIGCGIGSLRLDLVQLAGRSPIEASSFLRGHSLAPGTALGRAD